MISGPFKKRVEHFEARVVATGGRIADRTCRSEELLPPPAGVPLADGLGPPSAGMVAAYTCGCGSSIIAEVPYDGGDGPAFICGLCDLGTEAPRFA